MGSPNVNKVREDILQMKQTIPKEQFNEILNDFNLPPDVFDEGEKEEKKKMNVEKPISNKL